GQKQVGSREISLDTARSGTETGRGRGMSLNTARIGTETGREQRNESRYCENRDRKRKKAEK
ncbi:hypothetical protein, partial [Bacillus sp. AFS040349]|uniref:hypothetical protein n=1 Tax=Bacillus sp. AFS040349 TaxID=2033502 RepID=UPI000C02E2C0